MFGVRTVPPRPCAMSSTTRATAALHRDGVDGHVDERGHRGQPGPSGMNAGAGPGSRSCATSAALVAGRAAPSQLRRGNGAEQPDGDAAQRGQSPPPRGPEAAGLRPPQPVGVDPQCRVGAGLADQSQRLQASRSFACIRVGWSDRCDGRDAGIQLRRDRLPAIGEYRLGEVFRDPFARPLDRANEPRSQ